LAVEKVQLLAVVGPRVKILTKACLLGGKFSLVLEWKSGVLLLLL
jgi:hypothetical protein